MLCTCKKKDIKEFEENRVENDNDNLEVYNTLSRN